LVINERRVCINLAAPPVTIQLNADIRLHPKASPTLDDLVQSGFMTAPAAQLLRAIAASSQGCMVVGEPESGKTTLMGALAHALPQPETVVAVERAGEMLLPPAVGRLRVQWPVGDRPGLTFGEQIGHALALKPACVMLDEVRADEPASIAPLLQGGAVPRQIWSFRGAIFAKRLQSALGMLARRADPSQGEDVVRVLYQRLPFVIGVVKSGDHLRLWSVAEWQFKTSPDYPTYTLLLHTEDGQLKLTGQRPAQLLDLPETFWG
jgi:hypothetical protein